MIPILNILFLAGGLFLSSFLLQIVIWRTVKLGINRIALCLIYGAVPAAILAAAVISSSASLDSSIRFMASPFRALPVFAVYSFIAFGYLSRHEKRQAFTPKATIDRETLLHPYPSSALGWKILLPFLIVAAAVVMRVAGIFGAGNELVFALLAGGAALSSLPLLYLGSEPLAFIAALLPYLTLGAFFVVSPELVEGDSVWFHYPTFQLIARSFAAGRFLPPWLPQSGGIRIGFLHINTLFVLPHRFAGYFLYSLFPIPLAVIYKLQYLLGVVIFSLGWWLVLKKITGSRHAAYVGILMITLGGTGMTFHQEQVVATAYLLPWFTLALLQIDRKPLWLLPAAIIFGLSLTLHYPQIQVISFVLTAGALIALRLLHPAAVLKTSWRDIFLIPILILMAAAPSFYLWHNSPKLSSELRRMDIGQTDPNLREYLSLQKEASSASPVYFRQYLSPRWEMAGGEIPPVDVGDRCAFFVGRPGLLLAGIGLALALPKSAVIGVLLLAFALLSLGINSPIPFPKYFFAAGPPFFDVFRQWVHFFPMINFPLSLLAAIGVGRIFSRKGSSSHRITKFIFAGTIFFQVFDTALYGQKYLSLFPVLDDQLDLREKFFEHSDISAASLFQYSDRFQLVRNCGERAVPKKAFLAGQVLNRGPEDAFSPGYVCYALQQNHYLSAVTRIPETRLAFGIIDYDGAAKEIELEINFDGARGRFTTERSGLLVVPMNLGLQPRAILNGKNEPVWPANAALTGVLVEKGTHQLILKIPHDSYLAFFLIQWLLYLGLAAFLIREGMLGEISSQ